jgi:hypothetical protein
MYSSQQATDPQYFCQGTVCHQ